MATTNHHTENHASEPTSAPAADLLTPLERDVLDEYSLLVQNLDDLSGVLAELAQNPSAAVLDALRGLERKTSTVFTLLKASVYSIVLQQEIFADDNKGGQPDPVFPS